MLKYSQDSYSLHWIRQKMSGIQISIATIEKNFQRTLAQSLKVNVSGNSSGLWKSNWNGFTPLGSKMTQNVPMKPPNFLKGYSSSYDGISSWMKSRNAKTACTLLPYTEEQFLNKWEKVELLLILKDPRWRDEPGFQKPLGGSFLYHWQV